MRLSISTITKGKWWKIYLILLVIFTALGIIDFISEKSFEFIQISVTIISLVSLLGLLGYIYQSPVLSQFVWVAVFLANIMVLIYTFYKIHLNWAELTELVPLNDILISYGFAFVFNIPLLIALYFYAFNSSSIWSTDNKNT